MANITGWPTQYPFHISCLFFHHRGHKMIRNNIYAWGLTVCRCPIAFSKFCAYFDTSKIERQTNVVTLSQILPVVSEFLSNPSSYKRWIFWQLYRCAYTRSIVMSLLNVPYQFWPHFTHFQWITTEGRKWVIWKMKKNIIIYFYTKYSLIYCVF